MHDINFFSTYRTAKARSTDIVLIGAAVVVLVAAMITGVILYTNHQFGRIETEIKEANDFLNSQDTLERLAALQKSKQKVVLLDMYMTELRIISDDIVSARIVGTGLLGVIERTMPTNTYLIGFSIDNDIVTLNCLSPVSTDPMDFMHALKEDGLFGDVTISGIAVDTLDMSSFEFRCQLKGGKSK